MLRDRWLRGRRTGVFTLQWHLTNACGFHCRHCYDRSVREELGIESARKVVGDLQDFCRRSGVLPRLSLTGGDPLLYRHFWELYGAVAAAKIPTSILGNPIPSGTIQRLLQIQHPACYQVSLEGLAEHNDSIRGRGHFELVMGFLADARSLGLETHVMLTLTRANLEQVIPLGERLRGLTGRFTFNRLSQVGEGKDLEVPTQAEFRAFLQRYMAARQDNPVFGFKDNLFNILRRERGWPPLPGCTGFGCGAAFNFVALLPDGEIHACRKFPSCIGHVRDGSLRAAYHSAAARRYRNGPLACRNCALGRWCRGCLAVSHGFGLDPLKDRDPFCFLEGEGRGARTRDEGRGRS
jgi:selenobiotic family peptide radical SAM maturase